MVTPKKGISTATAASKPAAEVKKPRASMKLLGFMAVSPTVAAGVSVFRLIPGFDEKGPRADLDALIAKGPDWKGYALTVGKKGTLKVKALPKPKK